MGVTMRDASDHPGQSNERKPTLVALTICHQQDCVYGEPKSPTLDSVMPFGTPTSGATREVRRVWMLGYDAAVAQRLERNLRPPEQLLQGLCADS